MSTLVKNMLGSSGDISLKDWLNFDLTLDVLADASADIAANPSEYTKLLNKTINASVNGKTLEYEVIDFARYDKSDGSGKAGCVLMPKKELLDTHPMNKNGTSTGGWSSSNMRTWLSGLSRPSQAVQVKVPYVDGTGTTVSYSNDYLFLPSYGELCGKQPSGNRSVEGDIFAGVTNSATWRIRILSNSATAYFLRSVYDPYRFWYITEYGDAYNYNTAASGYGVLPIFCI